MLSQGSSTLLAYTTFLLSEILSIVYSPESVAESCVILESIFSQITSALVIRSDEASTAHACTVDLDVGELSKPLIDTSANSCNNAVASDGDVLSCDEVDWFFHDDVPVREVQVLSHSGNIGCSHLTDSEQNELSQSIVGADNTDNGDDVQKARVSPTVSCEAMNATTYAIRDDKIEGNVLHSDVWLAYGLQHCFNWEYEHEFNYAPTHQNETTINQPNIDKNDVKSDKLPLSVESPRKIDVALPMRLAMIAAESLWGEKKKKSRYSDQNNHENDSENADLSSNTSNKSGDNCDFGKSISESKTFPPSYSISTSARLFAERASDTEYNYFSFLEELSLDGLTVHTVSGVPSRYSDVRAGSLICKCKRNIVTKCLDMVHRTLNEDTKSTYVLSERMSQDNKSNTPYYVFNGVAVVDTGWDTADFNSGIMGEGSGASIQAHKLNHVRTRTVRTTTEGSDMNSALDSSCANKMEEFERSEDLKNIVEHKNGISNDNGDKLEINSKNGNKAKSVDDTKQSFNSVYENESSDSVYLMKCVALLTSLNVSVLFCTAAFCSSKLLDACESRSIAVFPMTTIELNALSRLCGAEIVGDILDLVQHSIGGSIQIRLLPFLSIRGNENIMKNGRQQGGNMKGRFARENEDDEVLLDISKVLHYEKEKKKKKDCHEEKRNLNNCSRNTNANTIASEHGNELNSAISDNEIHVDDHSRLHWNDSVEEECSSYRTVSVIIAAPTDAQTSAVSDRFLRCLHRLRAFIQGAGVMPGAGERSDWYRCTR